MIDILLATYNGEKYLDQQINSILMQSIKDWQLLIRDDGSSDHTIKIIEHYVREYPDKIVCLKDDETILGVTRNFERLMEYSTAPYVMFCDQDDIWMSDKIEKSLTKLQQMEHKYGDLPLLVYTDLSVCDSNGIITSDSFWKHQGADPTIPKNTTKALIQNNATGNTFFFNRKLCEVSLPFPQEAVMHDWWIALCALYLGQIDFIHDQTILYRQHPKNVSGQKGRNIFPMIKKLPQYCQILESNLLQSNAFLLKYEQYLNNEQKNILLNFSSLISHNRFNRVIKLLKYRFLSLNMKDSVKFAILILCPKKKQS